MAGKAHYETYQKRQAIVEHPFGIIKRQWGFDHIMTKKYKKRAAADVGLIFTAFNLRRIFNILSAKQLKEYLRELCINFLLLSSHFRAIYRILIFHFRLSFFEKIKVRVASVGCNCVF